MDGANEDALDEIREAAYKAALGGDVTAMFRILQAHDPAYAPKKEVRHPTLPAPAPSVGQINRVNASAQTPNTSAASPTNPPQKRSRKRPQVSAPRRRTTIGH